MSQEKNLSPLFGEYHSEKKLCVEWVSQRNNMVENNLRGFISRESPLYSKLKNFTIDLTNYLKTTSAGNNTKMTTWYEVELFEKWNIVEVWHLNVRGDRDRLVAQITPKP